MTDRYGNTRVAKISAAYNDLRAAIRSGDIEAAERALDRYEPWADYAFGAPKVKALDWSDYGQPKSPLSIGSVAEENGFFCSIKACGSKWDMVGTLKGEFETLDKAKAAAQADYERRILSALEGYND